MNFDKNLDLLLIILYGICLAAPSSIILVLYLKTFTECSEELKNLMPRSMIYVCGMICFTLIFLYYMHTILM